MSKNKHMQYCKWNICTGYSWVQEALQISVYVISWSLCMDLTQSLLSDG